MAKTESTAVNQLIDVVRARRAPPMEGGRDLFALPTAPSVHPPRMTSTIPPMRGAGEVAPLPRGRAPQSTATHDAPGIRMTHASASRGTTIPPLPPFVHGRASAQGSIAPPLPMSGPQPLFPVIQPPDVANDHWYESARAGQRERRGTGSLVKKLIVPTIALSVVATIACYLAFDRGTDSAPARATAAPAPVSVTPAPSPTNDVARPAPQVTAERPALPRSESENAATASAGGGDAEPPTKAEQAEDIARAAAAPDAPTTQNGAISFVDVRIDSTPPGATVTIVDRGKQTFIGTTPISTFVDPAREYDVILQLDGIPSRTRHIDPNKTSYIDVKLGRVKAEVATQESAASSSSRAERKHVRRIKRTASVAELTTESSGSLAEPSFDSDDTTGTDPDAATGILMVSTKPPCEILVDGKPTGLTTPQRGIELSLGSHKVTFINEEFSIRKSFLVKVSGEKASKLIRDMMPK